MTDAGDPLGAREVRGAVLHVRHMAAGRPGAPLLILVHSLGCDARIWDDVAARLRGQADLILYDLRGHGLSESGTPPYAMADHAADLLSLIEAEERPAHVCGLSIGGMVAMRAALDQPDRIAGLILCDTAARIGSAARYAARADAIRAGGMAAIADEQMERWFTPRFRAARPEVVRLMRLMLLRQPVDGYLGSVAALRDTDLEGEVGSIAVPTLCLVGAEDASTPPAAVRALTTAIPGAAHAEIPGAGHLPCLEAPERMAGEISRFLAGAGRA
ncbi:3-oxoadipate enol-lactonase [Jannaschia sp. LMIT008]|uniref:3-oxoadipate enol-lactonase n=1 Tax=Jannaschia maritima TaxID=3032585 RepID=UPI0028128181|nr:3-oxoadipate enol-lactonase [Jannaschia sp. LMIT008]